MLRIEFSEALDGASGHTPPKSAFEVFVDGVPTGFETVSVGGSFVALSGVSPSIKQDQAVVVTYTDPSANDDIAALQDTAGNDAASFTTGEDGVPAVSLGNVADPVAPDAPAGLVATAARRHADRPRLGAARVQRRDGRHGLPHRGFRGRRPPRVDRARRAPRRDGGRRGRDAL